MLQVDTPAKKTTPSPYTAIIERLLSVEEVAAILGVEKNTLAKWRVEGRPPRYVKIGRSTVRYEPATIRAFIAARDRASTAAHP